MSTLLLILLVLILLAVVGGVIAAVVVLGNRRRSAADQDALRQRTYAPRDPFATADDDAVRGDPRTLLPGDMVDVRGQSYAVRGTLRLQQSGYTWIECFLDTGVGSKVWLSVEDDPDLEVVLWQGLTGVTATPGPATVDLDGHRYSSEESGSASFQSTGTTGVAGAGQMRYHDYEAGGQRLSFEDFGGGWECSRGEVLQRSEYRIYPADRGPGR